VIVIAVYVVVVVVVVVAVGVVVGLFCLVHNTTSLRMFKMFIFLSFFLI